VVQPEKTNQLIGVHQLHQGHEVFVDAKANPMLMLMLVLKLFMM